MKIEVNIERKHFVILLCAVLLIGGGLIVVAYNANLGAGDPSKMGHSVDEVRWEDSSNNPFPIPANKLKLVPTGQAIDKQEAAVVYADPSNSRVGIDVGGITHETDEIWLGDANKPDNKVVALGEVEIGSSSVSSPKGILSLKGHQSITYVNPSVNAFKIIGPLGKSIFLELNNPDKATDRFSIVTDPDLSGDSDTESFKVNADGTTEIDKLKVHGGGISVDNGGKLVVWGAIKVNLCPYERIDARCPVSITPCVGQLTTQTLCVYTYYRGDYPCSTETINCNFVGQLIPP